MKKGKISTLWRFDARYIRSVDIGGIGVWECSMVRRGESVAVAESGFISTVCMIKITRLSIKPENCCFENYRSSTRDYATNFTWSLNYWPSTPSIYWRDMRMLLMSLTHLVMADAPHFSPLTTQLINSWYECDFSAVSLLVIILIIISSNFSLQL